MGEYPNNAGYTNSKPSRSGNLRSGAAQKVSAEDQSYMDLLSARVNSNNAPASPASQKRDTSGGANKAVRRTVPSVQGNAGGKMASPQLKKRPIVKQKVKRKNGTKLRLFSFIVALVLVCATLTYQAISRKIKDPNAASIPRDMGTLPEFKGDEINFLVCGIDYDNSDHNGYSSEDKIGRTDLLLYVNFNIKDNKASILQVPRDTYVGDNVPTGGNYKINSVYYFAPESSRMKSVVEIFNNQFGLPVDFYLTLDMEALTAIIDHLGYIHMYVPMEITDPENPGSFVADGWQNLTSEQLQFILRNRTTPKYNDQNDIARLRTQQSFYSALFRVFKQSSAWDVMTWTKIVLLYMKTNADLSDIIGVGLKALSLDAADITFVRPACAPVYYKGESLVTLIEEDFVGIIERYFHPLKTPEICTLPINENLGVAEAEIKTMSDIQTQEPPIST